MATALGAEGHAGFIAAINNQAAGAKPMDTATASSLGNDFKELLSAGLDEAQKKRAVLMTATAWVMALYVKLPHRPTKDTLQEVLQDCKNNFPASEGAQLSAGAVAWFLVLTSSPGGGILHQVLRAAAVLQSAYSPLRAAKRTSLQAMKRFSSNWGWQLSAEKLEQKELDPDHVLAKAIAAVINEPNGAPALEEQQEEVAAGAPDGDLEAVDTEEDEVEQVQRLPPTAWPTTDEATA